MQIKSDCIIVYEQTNMTKDLSGFNGYLVYSISSKLSAFLKKTVLAVFKSS